MNEKNVPKRWKFIFTFPLIKKGQKLVDMIAAANAIFPKNEHEYQLRKDYQQQGLIIIDQILQELQFMLDMLSINPDKMQTIVELCIKETKLLKSWRTSDKSRFGNL